MRVVDTKGQLCPAPLIALRRALKETGTDESFMVLTDNRTSLNNLIRFLKDNNTDYSVEESGEVSTLIITKKGAEESTAKVEDYCFTDVPHFVKGDFVVAFSSDTMGEGDTELGQLLIVNFIKALKDLDTLPAKIVFYNRGVFLGTDDSPVSVHLRELEKMGVIMLLCATCAKHYSIEDKINMGVLSNMYEIVQVMASAGNVVKP